MEITSSKAQEINNQYPTTSPHSSNGSPHQIPTTNPITRSHHETSTTFVKADTTSFKQVVQMLTGTSKTDHPPPPSSTIPPIKCTAQKKQGFKLYERRNSLKNGLMINTPYPSPMQNNNTGFSPRNHEMLSPSILDFPSLVLSPVTPLNEDSLGKASAASPLVEEEKAIAEKKFYFHPSPRTATNAEPQLLSLFPVTSPRVSGSSN